MPGGLALNKAIADAAAEKERLRLLYIDQVRGTLILKHTDVRLLYIDQVRGTLTIP